MTKGTLTFGVYTLIGDTLLDFVSVAIVGAGERFGAAVFVGQTGNTLSTVQLALEAAGAGGVGITTGETATCDTLFTAATLTRVLTGFATGTGVGAVSRGEFLRSAGIVGSRLGGSRLGDHLAGNTGTVFALFAGGTICVGRTGQLATFAFAGAFLEAEFAFFTIGVGLALFITRLRCCTSL